MVLPFTPVMFDSQSFTIVFECLPLSPSEAKLSHWWDARRGKFSFSAGTEARACSTICHQLVIWGETPVWVAAGFKNLLLHLAACPVLNNGQCWKLNSLLWKRRERPIVSVFKRLIWEILNCQRCTLIFRWTRVPLSALVHWKVGWLAGLEHWWDSWWNNTVMPACKMRWSQKCMK